MTPIQNEDDVQLALFGLAIAVAVTFVKWINSNRRTVGKLFGLLASSAVWGGLTAWGLKALVPDIDPKLLGVAVGVFAHAGTEATVSWFRERILGKAKHE